MIIEPCILKGRYVRLEPLTLEHNQRLTEIGLEEDLWRWTTVQVRDSYDMRTYIESALRDQHAESALPFATVDLQSGLAVGSTRFMNIAREHLRVEIGSTWVAPPWQRTVINTEAKYLMLRHAFEGWGCNRVELKTNLLNEKSRNSILRIGAKEEGTLRRHMINQDGTVRDTVYFSIISEEWPEVRSRLHKMLSVRTPSSSGDGD